MRNSKKSANGIAALEALFIACVVTMLSRSQLISRKKGFSVVGYHAGMSNEDRKKAQDAFVNEKVDIAVATVAFGMGIDRPNVRFVAHAAMPKSIEHYQQETGRAGRDGLASECVLFFTTSDLISLRRMTESSLLEAGAASEIIAPPRSNSMK